MTDFKEKIIPLLKPLIIVTLAITAIHFWANSITDEKEIKFTGYIVSDSVYLSPNQSLKISKILVKKGDYVKKGDVIYELKKIPLIAAISQLGSNRNQAVAQLNIANANLNAAKIMLNQNKSTLDRLKKSNESSPGSVALQSIDEATTSFDNAQQTYITSTYQLKVSQSAIKNIDAQLATALYNLNQASGVAPVDGKIDDVMFHVGEYSISGSPIVSIVPDKNINVRFFVPATIIHDYKVGTNVSVSCDSCKTGITAKINFISTQPEYTPPVIYSLESREKLVYMVEAEPSDKTLQIGLPIDVKPILNNPIVSPEKNVISVENNIKNNPTDISKDKNNIDESDKKIIDYLKDNTDETKSLITNAPADDSTFSNTPILIDEHSISTEVKN